MLQEASISKRSSIRKKQTGGLIAALAGAFAYAGFVMTDIAYTPITKSHGAIQKEIDANSSNCRVDLVSPFGIIATQYNDRCDGRWRPGQEIDFNVRVGRLTGRPFIMFGSLTAHE